jgi:molybdopterin-containing oxidoreductase family iron-sulfur binding subunit
VRRLSRREFLKISTTLASAIAVIQSINPSEISAQEKIPPKKTNLKNTDDILLRMQEDVKRALLKSGKERHWAMAIDVRKCIGCFSCTIACIAENKLPPGVVYRPVITEEKGTYPAITQRFWPKPCFHCDNPPCTPVCPTKATYKRQDGIVVVDYNKCIGCRYCITACPYSARYSDFGEYYSTPVQDYEKITNFEYKKKWSRKRYKSPIGNARKCHFCIHLIERGSLPRCVSTCIGKATFFGDLNDKESLIFKLSVQPNVIHLKEELGTKPVVFYLL